MSFTAQTLKETSTSTKLLCNRMAVVFDFDITLAPDTLDGLLTYLDIDVQDFRQRRVRPLLEEGWDKAAARCYCLVQESQQRSPDNKITREALAALGGKSSHFPA